MLNALESFLQSAIAAAVPASATVVTGPYEPDLSEVVAIHARRLELEPIRDRDNGDGGHLVDEVTWDTDGTIKDFNISLSLVGEIMEIQSPPGQIVNIGDELYVDERTLRFYHAPAAAVPGVKTRLRGVDAPGWQHQRDGQIHLDIDAWATTMAVADANLATALNVALSRMVELPVLEMSQTSNIDVWLRFQAPNIWLLDMDRSRHASVAVLNAHASVTLRGTLDVLVARGTPAPFGIIDSVEDTVALK